MKYKLTIPSLFADDRYRRDLPLGDGKWTSKGYVTTMTEEQLKELLSDAEHYCKGGIDPSCVSKVLINSARKTADKVKAILR